MTTRAPIPAAANAALLARSLVSEIRAEQAVSGFTQDALADAAGINRRTLGRYLTGERRIPLAAFIALASALGVEVPSLWTRAVERANRPARD